MKKTIYLLLFFAVNLGFAQDYTSTVKSYLQNHRSTLALESGDVSDIVIASQSRSKSLKADNVYVIQRYQGIEVYNSNSPFLIKDGNVINANLSFVNNLAAKTNSTSASVTAISAISKAAIGLGIGSPSNLSLVETLDSHSYIFSNGNISSENIPVKLVFQKMEDSNSLRLAWDLSIYLLDGSHYYSVRVDALTGNIIATNDWVVSCNFENSTSNMEAQSVLFPQEAKMYREESIAGGPAYRVFPIPLIGPNEGSDQLLSDPSDAVASPFGWHDTNGAAGAEFTITRGNNVLAQDDANGNNGSGFSPDGGASLVFDFPFNLPEAPADFLSGAVTNLFYMNNIMHDVFYHYGFDEASGNFQINNYGNGGNGGDFVFADAQDGSGINNANFGTPPDGGAPRMQMYLWSPPGIVLGTFMTVNNGPLAGQYLAFDSNFGGTPLPTVTPITADLVLVEDDDAGASTDPNDGCDNITNAAALNGKIAVVRRGNCNFTVKVQSAEAAGAVAVVVVNNLPSDPIRMGGTGTGIGIPAIMIFQSAGEAIITELMNGGTINASLLNDGSGVDTEQRDGDLDNVIIAHEYGHGISNRLTGGPSAAGCLQNQEQMGEGWSDYFGLMLTMKTGDIAEDARGIGTYALGQSGAGLGLRTKSYSRDLLINDFTYNSIKTEAIPHGVGSVWTTMLWDLTWDLIDEYGFDADIYNGNGGNNIALQLVMDGLKLQPCSPGFVDGRDAILEADQVANGGANRCIIWRAFARRGLGLSASQGSTNSRSDGTEGYDVPPECQLGIGEINTQNKFVVYPNPSNGEINIMSRYDMGDVSVSIFDMNGRKVFSQKIELHNTAALNASGLKSGIYLMQIEGADYAQSTKLIIN